MIRDGYRDKKWMRKRETHSFASKAKSAVFTLHATPPLLLDWLILKFCLTKPDGRMFLI